MTMREETKKATEIALFLLFGYAFGGVAFYSTFTDWNLLDSVYFTFVTLSSVGYGDLVPGSREVKLFTCAYIIVGVGILATALGEAVSGLLVSDDEETTPLDRVAGLLLTVETDPQEDVDIAFFKLTPALRQVLRAATSVLLLLCLGTYTFCALEGGDWVDGLFYSVVTVTTVGYGDTTPQTDEGKVFAVFYSLVGAILVARSLGTVAALPLEARRREQEMKVMAQYGDILEADELSDILQASKDLDLSGTDEQVTRADFVLSMLVRMDKVSKTDVREGVNIFNRLDIDGSGGLDEEDVELWSQPTVRAAACARLYPDREIFVPQEQEMQEVVAGKVVPVEQSEARPTGMLELVEQDQLSQDAFS